MTLRIKDLPKLEKPREKLKRYGIKYLNDEDLIAIILRNGTKNISVKELAINIKNKYPNLNTVKYNELKNMHGMGEVKALTLISAIELGKRISNQEVKKVEIFSNSKDIYNYFKYEFDNIIQEHLVAVFLDSKNKLINYKTIFIGTINMSITHPREIYKEAILNSCVKLVIIHNHPSGDSTPSMNDKLFTKQLKESGKIIGIPLIDHIIIGNKDYYSFNDSGELNEMVIEK